MTVRHPRLTSILAKHHSRDGRGIRDTLRGQVTHGQIAEEPNPTYTRRQANVYCWCQAEIVRGTFDRIARGLTESCGAPDCKEPTQ